MNTRTLYIVTGGTGQYSDFEEWFVRGFFDHKKAAELRDKLENRARDLGVYDTDYLDAVTRENAKQMMSEFDDEIGRIDYNGLIYFIQECRVDGE